MPDSDRRDALLLEPGAALAAARCARSNPEAAERAVQRALALAPNDIDVRLGAYRFYFYNHRLEEALPHADFIIAHAARRLNVPVDWRAVRREDAPFEALAAAPGLYLQALLAWGYCRVRTGARMDGCLALAKVAELDPRDRFGARRLLAAIESGEDEDTD